MDTGAVLALGVAAVVVLAMLATTVPRIREVRKERHRSKVLDEHNEAHGR